MSGFVMALFLLSSHGRCQGCVLHHPRTSLKPSNPQTIKLSNMGPCTKLTTRERPHSEGMLIHARPWRRNLSFRHIRPLLVQSQSGQPCKGYYITLICLTKPCPMGRVLHLSWLCARIEGHTNVKASMWGCKPLFVWVLWRLWQESGWSCRTADGWIASRDSGNLIDT